MKPWLRKGLLAVLLGYVGLGAGREFYDDTLGRKAARQRYGSMTLDQAARAISTPEDAQRYCRRYLEPIDDRVQDGVPEYWAPFTLTHLRQRGDCEDAAIAAMQLLADDGHPPWMLAMYGEGIEGHAVFLYQKDGRLGTVGINPLDYRPPAYASIKDIVAEYGRYTVYNVFDFSLVNRNGLGDLRHDPLLYIIAVGKAEPSTWTPLWRLLTRPFRPPF
jgi:hypothetical protein